MTRPSLIQALMAMALSGLGLPEHLPRGAGAVPSPTHRHNRGSWGTGKKRYHVINSQGKRVPLASGRARPACKFIPNVAGKRYEHGHYVSRRS